MGLQYRRRSGGKNTWANVSRSGVSVSHRAGPVTVNSRGRGSVRLGKGVSYRFGGKSTGEVGIVLAVLGFTFWLCWQGIKAAGLLVWWLLLGFGWCFKAAGRGVRALRGRHGEPEPVSLEKK